MTCFPLSYSFLIIITSGKKTTNLPLAGTVPATRWVSSEFVASGHNFSIHNSRSMERHSLHHPWEQHPRACQVTGTQTLWRNPTWVRAELVSNDDRKTTQKRVKSPLTTSPVNSQKWLVRGNASVVFDRRKSLGQGSNSFLWQSREAEQTSRMCLRGGRAQQGAQTQAQPFLRAWCISPRTEERLYKFEQWHLVRFALSATSPRQIRSSTVRDMTHAHCTTAQTSRVSR